MIDFLENYDKFGFANGVRVPLVIYDLGLSDEDRMRLPDLAIRQMKLVSFPFKSYPKFWRLGNDVGKYGWKAGAIRETLEKERMSVLWLDAGNSSNQTSRYILLSRLDAVARSQRGAIIGPLVLSHLR